MEEQDRIDVPARLLLVVSAERVAQFGLREVPTSFTLELSDGPGPERSEHLPKVGHGDWIASLVHGRPVDGVGRCESGVSADERGGESDDLAGGSPPKLTCSRVVALPEPSVLRVVGRLTHPRRVFHDVVPGRVGEFHVLGGEDAAEPVSGSPVFEISGHDREVDQLASEVCRDAVHVSDPIRGQRGLHVVVVCGQPAVEHVDPVTETGGLPDQRGVVDVICTEPLLS